MPFPAAWPPRLHPSIRSGRVYITGTAGAAFADAAYDFATSAGGSAFTPTPVVRPGAEGTVVNVPTGPLGGGRAAVDGDPVRGAVPVPQLWVRSLRITNESSSVALEFSFDGTNVHGHVPPSTSKEYRERFEAGIAVRGNTAPFRIEGW